MSKASKASKTVDSVVDEALESVESGPAVDAPLVGAEPQASGGDNAADLAAAIESARAEWAAESAIATEKAVAEAVAKAKTGFVLESSMVQEAVVAAVEAARANWAESQRDHAMAKPIVADSAPSLRLAGEHAPIAAEPKEFDKAAFDASIHKRIGAVRMAALTQAQLLVQLAGILPPAGKPGDEQPAERMIGADPEGKPNELEVLSAMLSGIDDPDLCMKEAAVQLNAQRLENEANTHVCNREMDVCEAVLRECREVRQVHLPTFERAAERMKYLRGVRAAAAAE